MATIQSRKSVTLRKLKCSAAVSLAMMAFPALSHAQQVANTGDEPATLEAIQVSGDWLGTGLQTSVKNYAGARTVVKKEQIEHSGASSISDVMRRIPGVQVSDNAATAGTAISLNIGVRGLTGRYTPRSTVLLDGIPLAFAPYGQPQLSFAPVSLNNIESIDVVRGGGSVRYGPQNVGGIINFKSRSIPFTPGITGDATVRENVYGKGGSNTQYSAFIGTQLDSGLGMALLYSGSSGSTWRANGDERLNDVAMKFRYDLSPSQELTAKVSYYEVNSKVPGGLTTAQYNADPFQNTRPRDFWSGNRKGVEAGYLNTISDTQEFEVRAYYNESFRQSTLIDTTRVFFGHQPRNYQVLGIEPRYTQRFALGKSTHDVTVGYRYVRERGDEAIYNEVVATGAAVAPTSNFDNATNAQAVYVDDRIAIGAWRITPGVRFEHIESNRKDNLNGSLYNKNDNKALPSVAVAYLLNNNLTVFGNYNTSYGPIQNTQLNAMSSANPLKPELAKTIEFGTRWTGSNLTAEATVFNLRFDNQIVTQGTGVLTTYRNLGATKHNGLETAFSYAFDKDGAFAGFSTYANFTYTRALQDSGATKGKDVPFYSRVTDTIGGRYERGPWGFDLSTTHQSKQYVDEPNSTVELANGQTGLIPGYRVWNTQVSWKVPKAKGFDILAGVNNLTDERFFTRASGSGKLVGAPRMVYVQARYAF
ncbi:Fe(3+) dicitrate transport protein FecA precursor [compost metagenome]